MSTYFYFRCLQHDPPLKSREEITQHRDEHLDRAVQLAQGRPVYHFADYIEEYFGQNALRFLAEHPECPVDIVSEYGEVIPIEGREKQ